MRQAAADGAPDPAAGFHPGRAGAHAVAAANLLPRGKSAGPALPAAVAAAWQAALVGAGIEALDGSDRVRIDIAGVDLDPLQLWPLLR